MVIKSWQTYQASAVVGDKEREEREESIKILLDWIQSWRPIMLMLIPGASSNIRQLPPTGATQDDVIRLAEDMVEFINGNPGADSFREEALNALGEPESPYSETFCRREPAPDTYGLEHLSLRELRGRLRLNSRQPQCHRR